MGRQPGNAVALVDWGLGIKWVKETWKIINCLINKKVKEQVTQQSLIPVLKAKVTGNKNIATGFNNFFVNIGSSLANDIPKSNDTFSTYLTDAVGDTLFLKHVTQAEIINLVNNTKRVIPCQINQFFAKFARPPSDFDEIWHTWR